MNAAGKGMVFGQEHDLQIINCLVHGVLAI